MDRINNLYKKQAYLAIFILFFTGCDKLLEDSPQASSSSFQRKNTLLDQLKPGEHEHNIADYFYDFNDYVNVQFIYYSEPYYSGKLVPFKIHHL